MGTPEFGVPTLEHLAGSGLRMVGVYTQLDRPSGRGKKTRKTPVKVMAEAHGLPVFQPETLFMQDARAEMESLKPDVAVVAAYGLILPKWTLDLPTYGVLNVHPSLLPRHRGPAPVANAILEGDEKTGVTVMKVEPKVDSGPILRSVSVEIGPTGHYTGALTERTGGDRGASIGGNAEGLGSGLDRANRAGRLAGHVQPKGDSGGRGDQLGSSRRWR